MGRGQDTGVIEELMDLAINRCTMSTTKEANPRCELTGVVVCNGIAKRINVFTLNKQIFRPSFNKLVAEVANDTQHDHIS